ncbi:FlgO family outer membrane protein [Rheinheimera texasensis]|uniref:FlgO family outer membrane protein n=1 Tax=Rheinheimera texasensis TaxID=306205 RepID=UPI0004E185BC|nr:FlgO family outer membrane protein [Rheinheimera texasensis]
MKKIHGLLLLSLSLSGCATWERYSLLTGSESEPAEVELTAPAQQKARPQYFVSPALYDGAAYQATQQAAQKLHPQYQPQATVNVNHYVQSMMHDLVANLDLVNPQMVIGMTSFVYLDGPYDQTDLLGNQLSESFMHEVHQFGLGVVDFKTTDYIRVTPQGDFVFSRDFMELKEEQPIEFVLGGTLVRHQGGTLINARLVSVASKKVAATAQGFIPQHVVDALYQSGGSEKLLLKQGE